MGRKKYWVRGAAICCVAYSLVMSNAARADAPEPSRHQAMKECMAKQRAADAGRTGAEMRAECRDLTKNARQNEATEKKAEENTAPDAPPPKVP